MDNQENKVPSSFEIDLDRLLPISEKEKELMKVWSEYLYTDSTPNATAEDVEAVKELINNSIERMGWEAVLQNELSVFPHLRKLEPVKQEELIRARLLNLGLRLRLDPNLQLKSPIQIDLEEDGSISSAVEKFGGDKLIIGNKMRTAISVDDDPGQYYTHQTRPLQLNKGVQPITEDVSAKMSREQIAARLPDTDFYHTSNGVIPAQVPPEVKEELVKSLVSLWIDVFGKDKLIESYTLNNPKLVEGLSDEAIEAAVMDGLNKLADISIDTGRAARLANSWCFPQGRFYPESANKVIGQLSEFLNKDGTLDLYAIVNRNKSGDTPQE